MRRFHRASWLAPLLAVCLTRVPAARACSVCRCGDSTFNSLGTNVFAGKEIFVAIDWDRLEKEQGVFEPDAPAAAGAARASAQIAAAQSAGAARDRLRESRLTATLAWAPGDRWLLVGRLPWTHRNLTEGDETTVDSGRSDPEFSAQFRLWSSQWAQGMGHRSWISAVAGVKTPWGENDVRESGVRLDEHAQPGTGSTDPFVGFAAVHLFSPTSSVYGSAQVRDPDRNDFGYRYGRVVLGNVGFEKKLGNRLDLAVEVNYRQAGRDQIDSTGLEDPNTGGGIAYVSPRMLFDFGHQLVGRITVQFPAVDRLNGVQKEKTVVNVGVTARLD